MSLNQERAHDSANSLPTQVVGLLDATIEQPAAVPQTIAVHPDFQRSGIGTRLLDRAISQLRQRGVASLEAWTRDDQPALGWYASRGFIETYRYLHLYPAGDEINRVAHPTQGHHLVKAFVHAELTAGTGARGQIARQYVCRRFWRAL
ncbi:GNAT family N-acetyltransferase [Fodinicola acaciae]|uniref:GNAT family N-acetyltransferase n=1 Tax=Fodinicola acaciae TaxID=2681555 RepID=UPI0013D0C9A7|nr:N-acetyltransferase [Fodinicola acaciae]